MDPYVYPGTNALKNLRDISDQPTLDQFEADATGFRIRQLVSRPTAGRFDVNHIQAIHKHIFQEIYTWAGQFRTVNISRSGQYPFAFAEQILPSLQRLSLELRNELMLEGLDRPQLCARGAYFLGELNAIHPFRDGNGRMQREFIRQLFAARGFALAWKHATREQIGQASRDSFERGDNRGLESVLLECCYHQKTPA
jgi:cell filamentation protein